MADDPTPPAPESAPAPEKPKRGQSGTIPAKPDPNEPRAKPRNDREKAKFFEELMLLKAEHRANDAVATALNWTLPQLEVFLAENPNFTKKRYDELGRRQVLEDNGYKAPGRHNKEGQIMLPAKAKPVPGMRRFHWTGEKRTKLLDIYIDTGDLMTAITDIGCTPSLFNREVEDNGAFAAAVKSARKQARQTLQMIATRDALKGNDKLLGQLMKDGDEDDSARRLTDAQLATRLNSLIARIRSRVATERPAAPDKGRAAGVPVESDGSGAEAPAEPVRAPLP